MARSVLLQYKRAVVFGAGGSIGAAVAKELASEGAEVFLSGRHEPSVEQVAKEIADTGGLAHTHVVDALDAAAVDEYRIRRSPDFFGGSPARLRPGGSRSRLSARVAGRISLGAAAARCIA